MIYLNYIMKDRWKDFNPKRLKLLDTCRMRERSMIAIGSEQSYSEKRFYRIFKDKSTKETLFLSFGEIDRNIVNLWSFSFDGKHFHAEAIESFRFEDFTVENEHIRSKVIVEYLSEEWGIIIEKRDVLYLIRTLLQLHHS